MENDYILTEERTDSFKNIYNLLRGVKRYAKDTAEV